MRATGYGGALLERAMRATVVVNVAPMGRSNKSPCAGEALQRRRLLVMDAVLADTGQPWTSYRYS